MNLIGSLLREKQSVFKSRYMQLCVVFRLVGGAQTPLRCHGELGSERVCGAEDPVGRRGVVVVLSDGAHHGGRPRDLPPGRKI